MSDIEFSKEERESIVHKLQGYFSKELDQEIGQFDAGFFLDFIAAEIGGYFYNRGLYDARTVFAQKMETVDEEIYSIEKILIDHKSTSKR